MLVRLTPCGARLRMVPGRPGVNRTLVRGFGDPCSTTELRTLWVYYIEQSGEREGTWGEN